MSFGPGFLQFCKMTFLTINGFYPQFCRSEPQICWKTILERKGEINCSVLNQWNNIVIYKLNLTLFRRNFVFAVRIKIFV